MQIILKFYSDAKPIILSIRVYNYKNKNKMFNGMGKTGIELLL